MEKDIDSMLHELNSMENYEEASNALLGLTRQRPDLAKKYASEILISEKGDSHMQAFAFNMLYRLDRDEAFNFIRQAANSCGVTVFAAMLSEVTDDVGLYSESIELREIVQFLRDKIAQRASFKTNYPAKAADAFLKAYA
jgi:hypothetical protein